MDKRVTPHKRVTSPLWGPPPLCKQALSLQEDYYHKWRRAEKPNFNLTTDNFSVKFVYNINIMGDKLLLNFWREIS